MPAVLLYSAPEEYYLDHISRCKEKFELLFPVFSCSIARIFNNSWENLILKDSFLKMILLHDLGKLTKRWQENVGTNRSLPSHSTIGACYLWKVLHQGLREPISFAVAIHHTDKGLLGDNIERPDVQAILDGIVDYTGNIQWAERSFELNSDLFPEIAKNITINDLKEMARGLRVWAKGCGLLEQHQRRMQASLAHHILKLCDISAAVERKEFKKEQQEAQKSKENNLPYYGGWLMVEDIKNYVTNLQIRSIVQEIKEKFNPQKIILFGSYAYGSPQRSSDIDLLVIMDTKIPIREQAFLIRREIRSPMPIDIIVRTPQQVEKRIKLGDFFIKQIMQKGVSL